MGWHFGQLQAHRLHVLCPQLCSIIRRQVGLRPEKQGSIISFLFKLFWTQSMSMPGCQQAPPLTLIRGGIWSTSSTGP